MGSKWADYAFGELKEQFPDLDAGVWNCRKIGGTSTWSQHAWGNALDLKHEDWGYEVSARNYAFLDPVYRWIKTYRHELSIRVLLWRTANHFNHIHIDGWPKGYGTPPCVGGNLRMQYNTGRVVNGDPGPVNGMTELPDKELVTVGEAQVLEKTNSGLSVADLQAKLIELGYNLGTWPPYEQGYPPGADGKFGGDTETGVADFQTSRELIATGKADGVTLYFINEVLGYSGQGELLEHGHRFTVNMPAQRITATTEDAP